MVTINYLLVNVLDIGNVNLGQTIVNNFTVPVVCNYNIIMTEVVITIVNLELKHANDDVHDDQRDDDLVSDRHKLNGHNVIIIHNEPIKELDEPKVQHEHVAISLVELMEQVDQHNMDDGQHDAEDDLIGQVEPNVQHDDQQEPTVHVDRHDTLIELVVVNAIRHVTVVDQHDQLKHVRLKRDDVCDNSPIIYIYIVTVNFDFFMAVI